MTRSLTTAVKNELATNEIRPIHLITIGFATPVNITDNSFSITSSVSGSSVNYIASDFILGLSKDFFISLAIDNAGYICPPVPPPDIINLFFVIFIFY